MKTTLFLLCLLSATAALGQSVGGSALSAEVQPFEMSGHQSRAAQHPMASEQSLLETSSYSYAQGERPLWEVAPVIHAVPLGDIARMLKKEHDAAKKATFVRND
jgi:hypothetical protein